jgi:predicted nucleic acid-binding protein
LSGVRPSLVDTSAWIAALRPDGSPVARRLVNDTLEVGLAVTADPVLAELAVGVRSDKERAGLLDLLGALPRLRMDAGTWASAAELGARVRAGGLTLPLVDLLIAQLALEADFEVLHADSHYVLLAEVVPLRQRWVLG